MFHQVREYESLFDVNGLQSTSLGLSFEVRPKHLASSALKLKCVSVISEVFLMSSEEFIVGDTVPSIPYPGQSGDYPPVLSRFRTSETKAIGKHGTFQRSVRTHTQTENSIELPKCLFLIARK
ncbi:uncharacterized protein ISCGN_004829 [Ixodes scapularis]